MTSLGATQGAEVVTDVLFKGDMKVTNLLQAEFNTKRPITGTILAARHTTCKENPKILIGKSNDFCLSF